jgi:hypothetical protein
MVSLDDSAEPIDEDEPVIGSESLERLSAVVTVDPSLQVSVDS